MLKINHKTARSILKIADKYDINLCLVGRIGIGKTLMISEYAKETGKTLHTLILSALSPDESLGIPSKTEIIIGDKVYPVLETVYPAWAVRAAQEEAPLIFMDEILTAPSEVFVSFLNFLTTKKIGDLDLSHAQIVFATNVEADTLSYKLPNNSLDRLAFFELTYNETSFLDYLEASGTVKISSQIIDKKEIGEGSYLYEVRDLSPRNFEKINKIAREISIKAAGQFVEAFTNKRYQRAQLEIVNFQVLDIELLELLNTNDIKSAASHQRFADMVASTARTIKEIEDRIPPNIKERVSASVKGITSKPIDIALRDKLVEQVKKFYESLGD